MKDNKELLVREICQGCTLQDGSGIAIISVRYDANIVKVATAHGMLKLKLKRYYPEWKLIGKPWVYTVYSKNHKYSSAPIMMH